MHWVNPNPVVRFLRVYVANHLFLLVVGALSASFVVFARSDVAKTREKKV